MTSKKTNRLNRSLRQEGAIQPHQQELEQGMETARRHGSQLPRRDRPSTASRRVVAVRTSISADSRSAIERDAERRRPVRQPDRPRSRPASPRHRPSTRPAPRLRSITACRATQTLRFAMNLSVMMRVSIDPDQQRPAPAAASSNRHDEAGVCVQAKTCSLRAAPRHRRGRCR
jgi:hypothetical protein